MIDLVTSIESWRLFAIAVVFGVVDGAMYAEQQGVVNNAHCGKHLYVGTQHGNQQLEAVRSKEIECRLTQKKGDS